MKIDKFIAAALVVFQATGSNALSISSGEIIQGEWNRNFTAAKSYADANLVPMLVFWGRSGCGYCSRLKTAMEGADFISWQQERKYVMVAVYEGDSQSNKCLSFTGGGELPRIAIYGFDKNGSSRVLKFAGRDGSMPVKSGSLSEQLMNSVDVTLTGWQTGATGSATAAQSVMSKAVTYRAAVRDGDEICGILQLKIGKGNKNGISLVNGKYTDVNGKNYTISNTRVSTAVWPIVGELEIKKIGSLNFEITEDAISGDIEGLPVSTAASVGSLTDGQHDIYLTEELTIPGVEVISELLPNQSFTVAGRKCIFPGAPGITYKNGNLSIVDRSGKKTNVSGIKFTVSATTGVASGSFNVYAINGSRLKTYRAKVKGLVVDGKGSAVATISRVGSFRMEIE